MGSALVLLLLLNVGKLQTPFARGDQERYQPEVFLWSLRSEFNIRATSIPYIYCTGAGFYQLLPSPLQPSL